jgi:hypothetical protein
MTEVIEATATEDTAMQFKPRSTRLTIAALALSAATVLATAALAQPPGPPGRFFDIDKLAVLLDLEPYQKTALSQIFDEQRQAREAARHELAAGDKRPTFAQMQARREAQQADTLMKLQGVLTDNQIAKFKILTERPARHPRPPATQ